MSINQPMAPTGVLAYATPPTDLYVPGGGRSKAAVIGISITMVLMVLAIICYVMQANLISRAIAGEPVTAEQGQTNDIRIGIVAVLEGLCYLGAAIPFLMWVHRVSKNVKAVSGIKPKVSPAWSVGYFFIPIINIWKPYKILSDVWNKSSSNLYGTKGVSAVGNWWGLIILSGIINNVGTKMVGVRTVDLSMMRIGTWVVVVGTAFSIFAGFMAIKMIRRLDQLQGEQYGSVGMAAAPMSANPYLTVPPPPARC